MAEPSEPDLFVYGTLLFPDVLRALLGRVPPIRPASAAGWRVVRLDGRVYPGLVPADGTAHGAVISGLSIAERVLIDAFEGDGYERRTIAVDGGAALAYVSAPGVRALDAPWDRDAFEAADLASFASGCEAWRIERAAALDD